MAWCAASAAITRESASSRPSPAPITSAPAFHGDAGEVAQSETRANLWTGASNPAVSLLLNLGMVAVVLVGAFRAQAGVMQPGKIVAFVSYFTLILNAAMTVSRLFVTLAAARPLPAASRRAQRPRGAPSSAGGRKAGECPHPFRKRILFLRRYAALRSVSFSLDEGQKLGIVGATGSGKSTLVHLLLRFYDASEGRVFLDGRDVRTIPFEELRTRFGVVFQNDFIMEGTVEENVDFCRGLPAGAAERALRIAQADFVFARPEGINCPLAAHGANLSGRAETAHPNRPRPRFFPRHSHPRRQLQRPRLPHGRRLCAPP